MAANDMFAVQQDAPLSITAPGLLANDTDAAGNVLTPSLFSGPAHGTLALQADGSFTYTPDAGFTGIDGFLYQDDDGASKSALAAVTLDVIASNAAPAIALDPDSSAGSGADFATTFTEGGGPVALADADATLADAGASKLTSLTATITNLKDGALESLSADTSGTAIAASYDGGSGVLTLYGSDSVANYLQVLKTVSYDNASQHPDTADRSITFVANDGSRQSNLATTTLSIVGVNNPPTAADDAYAISENNPLSVPATAGVLANDTDPEGDPLTATLVSGPADGTLTLNPDGSFNYVPKSNFSGADSFTYKASDGSADSNVATVNINVVPVNQPPQSQNDAYSVNQGSTLTVAPDSGVLANDTDVEGDPLTASLAVQPQHGTVTLNADGSFSYTPAAGFSGTDGFAYVANDGASNGNVAAVTITVHPVATPPVAANDSYSTNENSPLVVSTGGVLANDTDAAGDPLTASLVNGPQHGTATLNPDGTFTYTPAAGFSGTDGFSYKANDGSADSNVAAVTITVNPVVNPPAAINDHYSVAENSSLTTDATSGVLRNDTDTSGDPLSASLVDGPQHGTLTLNADGSFDYKPNANFSGADGFTYVANDGGVASPVAAVTITVDPVNTPPASVNDSYSATADTPLNVNAASGVLANDTDVDGNSLTATLVAGPQHGSLTLNADGSFSYTPAAGYTGADRFAYQAFDGEADGNVATVSLNVAAKVNQPPVAADDAYSVTANHTLNVPAAGVLANDTDPEGDPLTAALVDAPQHGTLTLNADGSFSYTPAAGYVGADSFTYHANDGTSDSNLATVSITVNAAVNHRPTATNDVYSTPQDSPLNVPASGVLANDADPDGDPLSAALFQGPQHGTLALNADGSFNYTPNSGYTGDDSFSYQSSDGQLESALAAVTIHVVPASGSALRLADGVATPQDQISAELSPGVRKLPSAADVDAIFGGLA